MPINLGDVKKKKVGLNEIAKYEIIEQKEKPNTKAKAQVSPEITIKPTQTVKSKKKKDKFLDNSAIKNNGFSVSHAITDAANLFNSAENAPIIGSKIRGAKTAANLATNMSTGAIKNLEGVADFVSDKVTNPMELKVNYVNDYIRKGKKVADENLKDLIKMQERDIKKNRTEKFLQDVGYNDVADKLEEGSLIKRDNFGGKVAQGLGGMVPSLVMGGALGSEAALTDLSKLAGKEKALAALGNVGKTYMSQLPANLMLGASSYGSGMEEALNEGATMDQARKFGLANAAIEQGTEMLTGGVPGLGGKGGLDGLVDPLIDKGSKGFTKAALKTLYRAGGEGLEEAAAEMLNPLARKIYSDEPIDWKQTAKNAWEAAKIGAVTGAVLNGPQTAVDFQNARIENNINKLQNLNTTERNALTELTIKRKNGQLTEEDLGELQYLNQKATQVQESNQEVQNIDTNAVNNMVDAQRNNQNFAENLQLQNTINPTLQETATQNGYKGDVESLGNIQTMLDNRGIQSRFDASMFNDNDVNALWMVDDNGNRQVVFNPNADENTIMEEISVHELAHDIMSSENSKIALKPEEVLNYAQTLEGYAEARQALEDTYAEMYGRDNPNFQALVDEEVVADFLGKKLGNQEFINRLNGEKPSLARQIYNWIIDKIDNIGKSAEYKAEKKYWREVADRFEKSFNMEYNKSTNETDVKFSKRRDDPLFTQMINRVGSKYEGELVVNDLNNYYLINKDANNGYEKLLTIPITQKNQNLISEIEEMYSNDKRGESTGSIIEGTKTRQTNDNSNSLNVEREETWTEYVDTILKRLGVETTNNTKYFEESNGNSKELDNSSFSMDNNGRKLTNYTLEKTKNSQARDENGNLLLMYHGSPNGDYEQLRAGTYFTPNKEYAQRYLNPGASSITSADTKKTSNPKVYEAYLNIENPFDISKPEIKDIYINEYIKGKNALGINPYLSDSEYNKINEIDWTEAENLQEFLEENHPEFDGLVLNEGGDGGYGAEVVDRGKSYIPFNEDQIIKANDNNTKYSKESDKWDSFLNKNITNKDNQGRTLSKQQQERFKNSAVRDENGNLKTMYHGTPTGKFNVFDSNAEQRDVGFLGKGFYFTDDAADADEYSKDFNTYDYTDNSEVKEVYLDMKNPYIIPSDVEYRSDMLAKILGVQPNQIQNKLKQEGYDGIIYDNKAHTEYVVFNPNQIKNVDNLNPTDSDDIRYSKESKKWNDFLDKNVSINEKTGKIQNGNGKDVNIKTTQSSNDKNLMVMQGLSVNNLKNVLSLGGLPVPSLGITNTKYTDVFDEFGGPDGAVLLFSKDTINPKIKGNEVYSRDVYSKTVPEIYQKVDKRAMNKVMDEFGPYESEYGTFNKHDYSKSSLDSIVNDLSYSAAAKAKFLDDNGYKFDKAYRKYKSSYGFTEEVIDKFLRENPDLASFNPMAADNTSEIEEIAPRIKEKAIDMMVESDSKIPRKSLEALFSDKWYLNDVMNFYRDIKGYRNLNGQKEFDIYTTRDNIDAAVEPHKQEFEDWLRNKFKDVYGDKYFENDSGRAKEYTLENLTSYMKKGNTQAQQKGMFDSFGIGQAKGGAAKQFKTIEQIREASSKLVDADTYKERHKAFEDIDEDVRTDIGDTRISKGEDLFDVYSDYYMALSKAASGVDPETALKNNYFTDLSKEQIEKFTEISQALADLPAKYFEAKPQRAVGLDEIKGIAVPNTIDAELREQLLNNGFTLAEYDPKVEGDKQRVINQFDDLKFSKQSKGWDSFLDRSVKSEGTKTRLKDLKVPKESKNIAESKENNVITVRNNQGQELKLKQDKTNPNVYEKQIKAPKDNKSVVSKEMMKKQLIKLKDGTKLSNSYSNITENSKFITQENMDKLSQEDIWRYAPQTNKETMENASKIIGDTQKSLESAYGDFLSKTENYSPEDVAQGWIFLKRFQDAGNYDAMVQVAKKMRNIATKSGQTVQMFNLQSRLTPEGMIKYAQSELMEAEQQFNKGKSQKQIDKYAKNFELTGEEVEYIKNQMEKIQDMPDGREKNIEMAKINKMLSDKLPHQKGDSIKAWMRMSMLFNPKTQVRNVVGNALITPINALADVPGALADKIISKKTGTRTLGAPSLGGLATYGKGFAKGGVEAWQDYRMGIDTKDVDMSRFDITQKSPFVTDHKGAAKVLNPVSKGLNKANSFLDLVMSGGDRVFYQGAFDASLRNQMQLNNVDTPTQDMIDIATQEALSRTWNDNNGYTQFVLNTRRALNKASVGGYGLGDVLIPFAKTPANLTKAIYDYSPVGLASTIFKSKQINNAIETGQITPQMQHDFAQNLGKGVAGTMLYALAYALAKSGIATGSGDDDKDVANFIKNTMGIQPYSIKIGDKSFTYDWAQPIAAPLAIATDAYKNLTKKSDESMMSRVFDTILDVSNTGINVLMQQSFLQGISEVLNSNEGVANGIMQQVIGLPARAVPTFVQQINNMFDKTQRVAYEKDQPLKTGKQNVMSKVPGLSQNLAPRVDSLGNEVQRYGDSKSEITYGLKNFLSPANQSNRKPSKAADEIYKVYEATGDKTVMPMVAPYYIAATKKYDRIDLDSKDRATYQKISGKLVNDAVIELSNSKAYQKLSSEEKADVLKGVVGFANAKAKEHFTGVAPYSGEYSTANKRIGNNMSIADYYLQKTKNKR